MEFLTIQWSHNNAEIVHRAAKKTVGRCIGSCDSTTTISGKLGMGSQL